MARPHPLLARPALAACPAVWLCGAAAALPDAVSGQPAFVLGRPGGPVVARSVAAAGRIPVGPVPPAFGAIVRPGPPDFPARPHASGAVPVVDTGRPGNVLRDADA